MSEPVFDVNDSVFDQDPKLIIRSIVAYPDRYFTPEFDIAQRDGIRQFAHRQNPGSSGPFPVPLLNTAIESEETDEWLLHRFMVGLDAPFPGAVNAIYPVPQMLEPPLHTAVRVGRADAVRMLLQHPTIDTNTVYDRERSEHGCNQSGFAHPLPCGPNLVWSTCFAASESAIACFELAEAGSMLRQNIENCALVFVAAGSFPAPIDEESGDAALMFARATQAGMNRYAIAILDRIFQSPPMYNHYRDPLLQGGLARILLWAAAAMDSSPLVQKVLDLSTENNVFPLPDEPGHILTNPIAAALELRNPRNACSISNFIRQRLNDYIQEPAGWVVSLIRNPDVLNHASKTDDNHVYFRELIDFVLRPPLLGSQADLFKRSQEAMERYGHHTISHCAERAFSSGKLAVLNATFAVEAAGCDTDFWLRAAIAYRNVGAFEAIISRWLKAGKSLDTPLSAVPDTHSEDEIPEGWTVLGAVVEARFLVAIEILLNAGAEPRVVSHADWSALFYEIERASRTLNKAQFVQTYFSYGFFQGEDRIISETELNENQSIGEHTRLILSIAQQHSDIIRVDNV